MLPLLSLILILILVLHLHRIPRVAAPSIQAQQVSSPEANSSFWGRLSRSHNFSNSVKDQFELLVVALL